jgi:hypothetical protein
MLFANDDLRRRARGAALLLAAVLVFGTVSATAAAAGEQGESEESPTTSADGPPKQLVTIEEQAEDIIDRVPGKRWARVVADIATVRAAWAKYQPRAESDGVDPGVLDDFDTALRTLTTAAKAKRSAATLQAANDLSRATVELLGQYDLGHPVQVGRLDIIGRQILLDLDEDDRAGVTEQIAAARTEWDAIAADVTTRSAAVGAQVDATLAALDEAAAAENDGLLKAEVRAMLEIVDAMEELYG